MTTSEIRDEMLRQQTIYEQSLAASAKAIDRMRTQFSEISDEDIELLREKYGIDISWIRTIDFSRVQEDKEYRNIFASKQEDAITRLHVLLEEALNVSSDDKGV